MDHREQYDRLNTIDLDQQYETVRSKDVPQQDGFKEKANEKIDEVNLLLNYELRNKFEKLGLRGDKCQIYLQSALVIHIITLIISTFTSMLISQISFLGSVWTFIPGVQIAFIFVFVSCLILIQFFQEVVSEVRINFILGSVHALSKIILIVNLTIWLYDIRLEMLLVSLNSVIGLIWFRIYVPTQKGEVVDLSFSYNYKSIIMFQLCVTTFLTFLIRSNWKVLAIVSIFTIFYAFYLILCIQRFQEHNYLGYNQNDLYLGALQIDADMIIPCFLINFLRNSSQSQSVVSLHASNTQIKKPLQIVTEEADNKSDERRIQSEKSIQFD